MYIIRTGWRHSRPECAVGSGGPVGRHCTPDIGNGTAARACLLLLERAIFFDNLHPPLPPRSNHSIFYSRCCFFVLFFFLSLLLLLFWFIDHVACVGRRHQLGQAAAANKKGPLHYVNFCDAFKLSYEMSKAKKVVLIWYLGCRTK